MSWLTRRDPTIKLAVVLGISLLLIAIIDPVTPTLFLALAVGAALAGGARPVTVLRALVPLSVLGVGFVWSNAVFFATQGPATWTIGPFHASEAGLRFGLAIAMTRIAIAMDARAFAAATDRTYYREARVGLGDVLYALGAALAAAGLIAFSAQLGSLRVLLG